MKFAINYPSLQFPEIVKISINIGNVQNYVTNFGKANLEHFYQIFPTLFTIDQSYYSEHRNTVRTVNDAVWTSFWKFYLCHKFQFCKKGFSKLRRNSISNHKKRFLKFVIFFVYFTFLSSANWQEFNPNCKCTCLRNYFWQLKVWNYNHILVNLFTKQFTLDQNHNIESTILFYVHRK